MEGRKLKGKKRKHAGWDLNEFLTEIRTFYSLKEIRESIEQQINQYKMLLEDYSQWVGTLEKSGIFKESGVGEKGCSIAEIVEDGRQKRRKKGREKTWRFIRMGSV